MHDTVDIQMFKVMPVFNSDVSRKRLVIKRNGPKFGPPGSLVYIGYIWSLNVQGQLGHSVYFRFWQDYIVTSATYISYMTVGYTPTSNLFSIWQVTQQSAPGLLFAFIRVIGVSCDSPYKTYFWEFLNFKLIKDWSLTLWTVGKWNRPISWKWVIVKRSRMKFGTCWLFIALMLLCL